MHFLLDKSKKHGITICIMIEVYFNNKKYYSYYQLLIDEFEKGNMNVTLLPHAYHIYICSLLNDKFPEKKITVETVKRILAEELALNHIKRF